MRLEDLLLLRLPVYSYAKAAERLKGPVHQPCLTCILSCITLREALSQIPQEILQMEVSLQHNGHILTSISELKRLRQVVAEYGFSVLLDVGSSSRVAVCGRRS